MADADKSLLTGLLKQVSRSFYLTLRILPRAVRPQIGLAYLLARTTDTIADTEIIPLEKRLTALGMLRSRIFGQTTARLDFGELAQQQGLPAERVLLERVEDSLALLSTLSPEDLELVRQVIDTIAGGQELDLMRFGKSILASAATNDGRAPHGSHDALPLRVGADSPGNSAHGVTRPTLPESATPLIALQKDAELDNYTYRVAGCVGEFWTKMCRTHLFPDAKLDEAQFLADGVRFGKGLQLVNILRDLPRDLQQGRCYIPVERLDRGGLKPADLRDPGMEKQFRPVYHELLDLAEAHLAAGWRYTNTIPANQWRVRLACAWPILIGVRTLQLLRAGNPLDPAHRIKTSRAEVRSILWVSTIRVPFPGAFRNLWRG